MKITAVGLGRWIEVLLYKVELENSHCLSSYLSYTIMQVLYMDTYCSYCTAMKISYPDLHHENFSPFTCDFLHVFGIFPKCWMLKVIVDILHIHMQRTSASF